MTTPTTSGVDFAAALAALKGQQTAPAGAPAKEKQKSFFWANIGYNVPISYMGTDGVAVTEEVFVGMPFGIMVDLQQPVDVKAQNSTKGKALAEAKNLLLSRMLEKFRTFAPGEHKFIGDHAPGKVCIQLRRVNDEAPALAADHNPFIVEPDFGF